MKSEEDTNRDMKMTSTFNLTIVRHGQAESNLGGNNLHGSTESPLTELGRSQAEKVGQRFKGEHFDIAYSSSLSRAFDTGTAIVGDSKRLIIDDLVIERNFGRFENKPNKDFTAVHSEAKKSPDEPWLQTFANLLSKEESVESDESMQNRISSFVEKVVKKVLEEGRDDINVLVACHGMVVRAFVVYMFKTGKSNMPPKEEWQYTMVPNTAVTKFKIVVDKASGGIQSVVLEGNLYCSAHLEYTPMQY